MKFTIKRQVKRYYGQKITKIIENQLTININGLNKEQEITARNNPNNFINEIVNKLIANGNYTKLTPYSKTGNKFKRQLYLYGKYYLTCNEDNIKDFEKDYNFFIALGLREPNIKKCLKYLYNIG